MSLEETGFPGLRWHSSQMADVKAWACLGWWLEQLQAVELLRACGEGGPDSERRCAGYGAPFLFEYLTDKLVKLGYLADIFSKMNEESLSLGK